MSKRSKKNKSDKPVVDRPIPKLGFGPMSSECIHAIYEASHQYKTPLMLIASRNQVDTEDGYVMTTAQLRNWVIQYRSIYPDADVWVCRDHLGINFKDGEDSWDKVNTTLVGDLRHKFDIIHLDFSRMDNATALAIVDACDCTFTNIGAQAQIEVGLTEIGCPTHQDISDLIDIVRNLVFTPLFISTRTGIRTQDATNIGEADFEHIARIKYILSSKGIRLKEHNADFLSSDSLSRRKNYVDALNIAPQLGTVQTSTIKHYANMYGLTKEWGEFERIVVNGNKWQKWISTSGSKDLACMIAGHYHFRHETYLSLVDDINRYVNLNADIIDNIKAVICHYIKWFV